MSAEHFELPVVVAVVVVVLAPVVYNCCVVPNIRRQDQALMTSLMTALMTSSSFLCLARMLTPLNFLDFGPARLIA